MRKTVNEVLKRLGNSRKAFYSEADFQFAFAWELKSMLPNDAEIRLERPIEIGNKLYYIDILVVYKDKIYPIELKYKTKKVTIADTNGDIIPLANHAAVDLGCYAYIKDISRIEDIKKSYNNFGEGFAIMITNEPIYYIDSKRKSSYMQFKIFDKRVINGVLKWEMTQTGKEFVLKDKFPTLNIKGSYTILWENYNNKGFKYTITEIK